MLLIGFIVAAAAWAGVVLYAQQAYPSEVWSSFIALLNFAVGFLLSAYIGMHIYFFTTARSQEREWRQRYRVDHAEDIFSPLYDEIVKVIESVEDWAYVRLEEWPKVDKSHFGFFVGEPLKSQLGAFEKFIEGEYTKKLMRAQEAARAAAVSAIQTATANRLDPAKYSTMNSYIEVRFLLDPARKAYGADMRRYVRETVGNLDGTLVSDEVLDQWFVKAKEAADGSPEVAEFRASRTKALAHALVLRGLLGDRVQRPYAIEEL